MVPSGFCMEKSLEGCQLAPPKTCNLSNPYSPAYGGDKSAPPPSPILRNMFFPKENILGNILKAMLPEISYQLEMAAILRVQLTSTFANMAQNTPQDVLFHMNHVTFGWQKKGRVSFHLYAELDY